MSTRKLAVGLVVTALALTACNAETESGKAADGTTTIRLGISPFQDTMLPIIAEEKGWFKAEGLNVELKSLAWDAIMPAVASNGIDAAINNTTGVVSVANKADNVVYWYAWNPFTEGSALMGKKGSGLKTLEEFVATGLPEEAARAETFKQLKGRTIVTTMSTDMGKQVVAALESVGLKQSDVKLVDLDPDQGLAAFLSGTGDAYLGGIPQRVRATAEGMPVLASGPDLAPPPINGLVTTTEFAGENEEALLKLVKVFHRIVRYCDANTADCGKTITERLNRDTGANLTVQGFQDFWQKFELYAPNAQATKQLILDPSGISYWKKTWDGDNSYLTANKSIPAPVDAGKHFLVEQTWNKYVEKYGADETGF
ncbi:ABC transporter substrate-binding protein [Micromonospora sp. HUAS LYJ1]|uniref:ABC transporter substrate-binding protein n=1 Tax=Micromonospora sp. HUAS LYJ1 TaxID=3061626 RepID=UPI0026730DBB|nr:ABC transporter substrate-binding protein [Micromonospora sp. HUAS LYJ1]WKU03354.1 ABC transporter substrate-binding protein [Micromonospora sp. HUAS LYJ1]